MKTQMDDPRLTAYALGELDGDERRKMEALVASSAEAREAVEDVRRTAALLEGELAKEPMGSIGEAGRQRIEARVLASRIRRWAGYAAAACVVLLIGGISASVLTPTLSQSRNPTEGDVQLATGPSHSLKNLGDPMLVYSNDKKSAINGNSAHMDVQGGTNSENLVADASQSGTESQEDLYFGYGLPPGPIGGEQAEPAKPKMGAGGGGRGRPSSQVDLWAQVRANNTTAKQFICPSTTDSPDSKSDDLKYYDFEKVTNLSYGYQYQHDPNRPPATEPWWNQKREQDPAQQWSGGEAYDGVVDNPFFAVLQNPLSTFSIDVDTASYSNIRRMLNSNSLPPAAAVRIEEMVNYFSYDYPQPEGDQPFSVNIETASCPWSGEHRLIRVGLKGREIPQEKRLPCNLVFLIDVSGSMDCANKLPLVKQGLAMLVQQLSPEDRVAMVVYAGASGLALPSTPVSQKDAILSTIDHLEAGGSTNGGEGIQLAYKIAGENFNKEGVNRVILATDGDFNVGVTDQKDLVKLVEEKAKGGVFLSVLGFGMGNLKDATLEKLADKGNGNYTYIDTFAEAKKVLVDQMAGTLVTIAKDVKIQIEFNPGQVAAYRLIGYENRILAAADFNNDKKDAGEIGAGHTVTALYEIVPTSASTVGVDPLKYQPVVEGAKESRTSGSDELLTLKLRYKRPDGDTSKLIESPVKDAQRSFDDASDDLKFAASVAAFGMLLRNSPHKGDLTYDAVLTTATRSMGKDASGYRAEFVDLVRKAKTLSGK